MRYDHKEIEPKWQEYWEREKIFRAETGSKIPKLYVLDMFAYPSGEGLHVGHPRGYTASDILAKYYRMQGKNVLHPFGWDAFGLPAENYAIKVGTPPAETTAKNIECFKHQLTILGLGYDWDREINTSQPEYYKWTQWLFKVLFDNSLAYQKEAYVNWCPKCQTVLANEQVSGGQCERCDAKVEQKKLKQWFFKITDFAQELIDGLDGLDWPESTKEMQRNWIGRSEGAEIEFRVASSGSRVKVFTTRPDTLFGATYLVLAPEHELVSEITAEEQAEAVGKYIKDAKSKSALDRTTAKEKTGVFTGAYAINPGSGEKIPIWVADYVLADYGFGAVMAVPAHDERDFEFATKYKLPIIRVVESKGDLPYTGHGKLIGSGEFDELDSREAAAKITKKVGGEITVQYKLHDWLISRQRYWGAPIPIVHVLQGSLSVPRGNIADSPTNGLPVVVPLDSGTKSGGDILKTISVGVDDLPVLLPTDVDFKPSGESPLTRSEEFQRGVEDKYGKGARREVDTMDTFVCSSWYFLRYCDPRNKSEFAGDKPLRYWMPVDLYIGGTEHINGHLLYARFITRALHKLGYLNFDEPFLKLRHQGMILGEDSEKMSKSRGNVVNPDEIIEQYGADTMRMYEMFVGPFALSLPWNTRGIVGVRRFLDKTWQTILCPKPGKMEVRQIHQLVQKVTADLDNEKFNTAVSSMMEFINQIQGDGWQEIFVKLLAPFAPHLAEELWRETLKKDGSIFNAPWPKFDANQAKAKTVIIVVAENGKKRGILKLPAGADEQAVLDAIRRDERLANITKRSQKHIFVPDRMINFIV